LPSEAPKGAWLFAGARRRWFDVLF
jgi:hypothetical protein